RDRRNGVRIDPSGTKRDFLQTSDFQSLPAFDRFDEIASLQQGFVRARIQPGETASHYFYRQAALFEVCAVDVRDLELAAGRRLQLAGNGNYVVVVKIKAGHCVVGTRRARLFFD